MIRIQLYSPSVKSYHKGNIFQYECLWCLYLHIEFSIHKKINKRDRHQDLEASEILFGKSHTFPDNIRLSIKPGLAHVKLYSLDLNTVLPTFINFTMQGETQNNRNTIAPLPSLEFIYEHNQFKHINKTFMKTLSQTNLMFLSKITITSIQKGTNEKLNIIAPLIKWSNLVLIMALQGR